MKLISVHAEKPIAVAHVRPCVVEHPAAEAILGKEDGILTKGHDALIASAEVLHYFPGLVNASGVKDVHGVAPCEQVRQTLGDDVSLVPNGQ